MIYDFARINFICWRKTVTSTGETIFATAVETSRMHVEVGIETGLSDAYFMCINKHLYNADPIFLPLSTDKNHMIEVSKILQTGIREGWEYQPAASKGLLSFVYTRTQLSSLENSAFVALPAFAEKVFCSPIFRHLNATMSELCDMYDKEDICMVEYKSLNTWPQSRM